MVNVQIYFIIGFILLVAIIFLLKNLTIVPPHEIHVISGRKFKIFDGSGRYFYIPFLETRNILSKAVIEIIVPKINLHDKNYLPFAVEISCKVQIGDPRTAAEALGIENIENSALKIRPIVDDTIQSASRSQAMQYDLQTIMRERDVIEESIYTSTSTSLSRVGVRVTLFDIKNIVDTEGSTVINDLERVRSAEINKLAREAEATQMSQAEIVEADKKSAAEIKRQASFQASEEARLEQEQTVAQQRAILTTREMEILDIETKRKAEITREKVQISAEAEAEKQRLESRGRADAALIEAQAEAASIKVRAEAEAERIKMRLLAEAEGTEKLAKALKSFNDAGIGVKIAEINADAQKVVSENVAKGIQHNTK
ncbi:MAG: SPFH domain-containing protein, partial [Candidatus Kariarchaeaceae archaeon]